MKTDIPFHEAADIFPLLNETDLDDLANDIATNGQREPILLYDGKIIDGRNRYNACEIAGVEPMFDEWKGEPNELIPFVMSLNLHRRHLTSSQRQLVAARLANLHEGRPKKTPSNEGVSQLKAAEIMNVSVSSVERAAAVIRDGTPEQIKAIESGESTVNAELQKMKQALKAAERKAADIEAALNTTTTESQRYKKQLDDIKAENLRLADMKKPETITKEVVKEVIPPDYEKLKFKLDTLENENKLLKLQVDTRTHEDERDDYLTKASTFTARIRNFIRDMAAIGYLGGNFSRLSPQGQKDYEAAITSLEKLCQDMRDQLIIPKNEQVYEMEVGR